MTAQKQIDSVIKPGKSADRVFEGYKKYPNDWIAEYEMLLPDGVTCGDCMHSKQCKSMFGGNDNNEKCQFHPNRFTPKELIK